MTTWYDAEKVSNKLLKALQDPRHQSILESITYRKAVVLVPLNSTLDGIEVTTNFILTHIMLTNSPPNNNEFVTLNGVLGLLTPSPSNNVYTLLTMQAQVQIGTTDKQTFFESMRSLFDTFKKDKKARQSIQVLREDEVLIRKHYVKIMILDTPIEYDGCSWAKPKPSETKPPQSSESKSFFSNLINKVRAVTSPDITTRPTPARPSSENTNSFRSQREVFWMKVKNAPEIAQNLKQFVKNFQKRPPVPEEQSKIIKGYIDEVMNMVAHHKQWASASEDELDVAQESIEKFIMTKLFNCCFAPAIEDIERDKALHRRLQQLQFILPEHLDIASHHRLEEKFGQAIEELRKINSYKAPRDKMVCILNCCKLIYSILNRASKEGHPAGADEFLPLLIYIVLKANPPQLHSNVQYILRFRASNKMITEAGYYFTHLESAIDFLEKLDASKLTIDADEFERLLAAARKSTAQSAEAAAQHRAALATGAGPSVSSNLSQPTAEPSLLVDNNSLSIDSTANSIPISPSLLDLDLSTAPLAARRPDDPANDFKGIKRDGLDLLLDNTPPSSSLTGRFSHSEDATITSSFSSRSSISFHDEDEPTLDDTTARFLTAQVEDLRIKDIPALLEAYKALYSENQRLHNELILAKKELAKYA